MALINAIIIFPIGTLFSNTSINPEYLWLAFGPLTILLIIFFMITFYRDKKYTNRKLFKLLGETSLELYMTHIILLNWFKYYGLLQKYNNWCFLIIPGIAVLWTTIIIYFENIISKVLMKTGR